MEALLAAAQSNPSPGQGQRNLCSLREYSQCHLPKDKPLLASSEQLQQYRTKSTKRGPVLVWNVGREAEPSPAQHHQPCSAPGGSMHIYHTECFKYQEFSLCTTTGGEAKGQWRDSEGTVKGVRNWWSAPASKSMVQEMIRSLLGWNPKLSVLLEPLFRLKLTLREGHWAAWQETAANYSKHQTNESSVSPHAMRKPFHQRQDALFSSVTWAHTVL